MATDFVNAFMANTYGKSGAAADSKPLAAASPAASELRALSTGGGSPTTNKNTLRANLAAMPHENK
jgi:hypothetical protein